LFPGYQTSRYGGIRFRDQGGEPLATLSFSAELEFSGLRREVAGHIAHPVDHRFDGLGKRIVGDVTPQIPNFRGPFAGTLLGDGLRIPGVEQVAQQCGKSG